MQNLFPALIALFSAQFLLALPVSAQEPDVPYWAALDDDEANMRVGPSRSYQIDWVYRRLGLPVKVIRTNQGWRYIEDHEGNRGWMFHQLLTRERGAIVISAEPTELYELANSDSRILWLAEPGVVGQLGECDERFCEFTVGPRSGWVPIDDLWGEGAP